MREGSWAEQGPGASVAWRITTDEGWAGRSAWAGCHSTSHTSKSSSRIHAAAFKPLRKLSCS